MIVFLILAVGLLAYSNGANDNFKGVASLFGSRTTRYRPAIIWATVTTFAGSVCSIVLAQALLNRFSGRGLVPDKLAGTEPFLLAVAAGAGITVIVATITGFPISTTHGLIGAMVGSGLVAAGGQVNLGVLRQGFLVPLLLSPLLAIALGALLYVVLRFLRLRLGISKEFCVCIGTEERVIPLPQPTSVMSVQRASALTIAVGTEASCSERYAGTLWVTRCLG